MSRMSKQQLATLSVLASLVAAPLAAEEIKPSQGHSEEALLKRVEALEAALEEKESELSIGDVSLEFFGLVELEAGYVDPYEGGSSSDFTVATAALGVIAQVHSWAAAEISVLYEEDDTDLEVDVATLTIADPDAPWFMTGGQQYLPFGSYGTQQISDPLTLSLGEARESALLLGFAKDGLSASAYGFNGDLDRHDQGRIDSFGIAAGYEYEFGDSLVAINLGYINNLGDSDTLQDVIQDELGSSRVDDYVDGVAVALSYELGALGFNGEYLAATERFDSQQLAFSDHGARPESWQLEASYRYELAGLPSIVAVAYQGSSEALGLELPEERISAAVSAEIFPQTLLGLEYAYDSDYSQGDGGTDENASTVTLQLAYEF